MWAVGGYVSYILFLTVVVIGLVTLGLCIITIFLGIILEISFPDLLQEPTLTFLGNYFLMALFCIFMMCIAFCLRKVVPQVLERILEIERVQKSKETGDDSDGRRPRNGKLLHRTGSSKSNTRAVRNDGGYGSTEHHTHQYEEMETDSNKWTELQSIGTWVIVIVMVITLWINTSLLREIYSPDIAFASPQPPTTIDEYHTLDFKVFNFGERSAIITLKVCAQNLLVSRYLESDYKDCVYDYNKIGKNREADYKYHFKSDDETDDAAILLELIDEDRMVHHFWIFNYSWSWEYGRRYRLINSSYYAWSG